MTSRRSASCCAWDWARKAIKPSTRRTPRRRSISWQRRPISSFSISGSRTCRVSNSCAKIRAQREDLPIVVLSSRGDEAAKVEALDLGADDYVTKPFSMEELLARMRAALRHQLQVHGDRPVVRSGDLSVDLVRRIVKMRDQEVKLSPKEYELLRLLVHHAGKVLTHKFLLQELWSAANDAQYLRVYVRQLRQKIEPNPARPQYILTETGIGYRLRAPD